MTAALAVAMGASQGAYACEEAGQVASVEGEVTIQRVGEAKSRNAAVQERLVHVLLLACNEFSHHYAYYLVLKG